MRIAGIVKGSTVDGPGVRNVVFIQGCAHGCKGCHNPETHDFSGGSRIELDDLLKELVSGFESGEKPQITISGGDPFYQPYGLEELCRALRVRYGSGIWIYTGFLWETICHHYKILRHVDVLVDGPYIEERKTLEKPFVGSDNQRLIDCKRSLTSGRMVLWRGEKEPELGILKGVA